LIEGVGRKEMQETDKGSD